MIGIECTDSRDCFAKMTDLHGIKRCTILSGGYVGDTCPFQKAPGTIKTVSREELEKVKVRRRSRMVRELDHEDAE